MKKKYIDINNVEINIYKNFEVISELWKKFYQNSNGYPFQSFEWVSHWHFTIGKAEGHTPQIVIVKDKNNKLLMLLPLSIKYQYGINVLLFSGGDYASGLFCKDFYDYLTNESFNKIFNAIINKIKNIDLVYFSSQPQIVGLIKNPMIQFLPVYLYHAKSHQIVLNTNLGDYFQSVKKRIINDTKRQSKRLNKLGKVSFEVVQIDKFNDVTDIMIEQKSKQYLNTKVKDQFELSYNHDFYKDLSFISTNELSKHISVLKIDSTIIATHWGLFDRKNSTLFYLMPSHDNEHWGKFSPGRLLMIEILKWCIDNNIKIFDMTGGNEPYKFIWANNNVKLFNYLQPITFIGTMIYFILKLKHFLRNRSFGK